ncbi:MAG TPA: SUMF1/EgtB/PvdO family nonheme iron enzyme [Acidobacteriaceae bacterium]|nr:SUMF1/EgtB/PvdO family nonheme iron enzyme [Acidobacteriaceae bacterium]
MPQTWNRRRLLQLAAALAPGAVCRFARADALSSAPLVDKGGAEYALISPGTFSMGNAENIPLSMCEPLAYMTRSELQAMFPHGDPARFVLSDVLFEEGDFDERPAALTRIDTPFYLGVTQVTNRQYERFDPAHRKLRGKFGFSRLDNEAVIYVSWHDAVAYCEWLSKQEQRPFRLPTEAEWEYAARAGTTSLFSTGDSLPNSYLMNARVTDFASERDKVSLLVGQSPPNPWGLFDVHGNVEEWVQDWYAPYSVDRAKGGSSHGLFKVTRGGSHGTFAYYLRSANRAAALPETRGFTIGFRVACDELPAPKPELRRDESAIVVSQESLPQRRPDEILRGPQASIPYFQGPRQFVKIPEDAAGPLYHWHNHDTGLAECPNGDMLAIWYTCAREQGRELSIAASRLPFQADAWDEAYSFYDTPDRNDHCPALWFDGHETLYHLNGTALSHYWEPLQIILRSSKDNGATWSTPRYIAPDFGFRNMVCQPILRLKNGWWIFGADAHPQSSAMWLSKDEGTTWEDTGGSINGIHASIVELKDGRIMALGRGDNIDGHLPMSISDDYGKTWHAVATDLPPITYTQRFSMHRLAEGPIALATFLPDLSDVGPQKKTDRELAKLCICLSYDEGKTWPVRRILTDDKPDHGITGMSNGRIYMGPGNAEPTGYVTLTQARNGLIHVVSSMDHYEFNLKWAENGLKDPSPLPQPRTLARKTELATQIPNADMHRYRTALHLWTNERTGALDTLNIAKGFTVEAQLPAFTSSNDYFILRAFVRSGCTMCNRYWLRASQDGVSYWYAGRWQHLLAQYIPNARIRMAVREDTCVQIYYADKFLASYPASYEIGFAAPTRGSWFEWEYVPLGQESEPPLVAYDMSGAFGS